MRTFYRPAAVLALVLLCACQGGRGSGRAADDDGLPTRDAGHSTPPSGLHAEVIRTEHGIPHIFAGDFTAYGYAVGYVQAEDTLCTLAQDYLTIRGERARYFGRDGSYTIYPNGSTKDNVTSDFFWRHIATDTAITPLRDRIEGDARAATEGFVRGYNRYVAELRAGGHPGRHLACRDAEWIGPITSDDMYRRYLRLLVIASSGALIPGIATAQPPSLENPPLAANPAALRAMQPGELSLQPGEHFGSNLYALGPQGTADGSSMLLANPHFPWLGSERFHLMHAILPGINIQGVTLLGFPGSACPWAWTGRWRPPVPSTSGR